MSHTETAARIVRDPAILGGEPTIQGTRVSVSSIVMTWRYYRDLERVRGAYPRLSIATIQAALAYYERHRDEIDRLIAENEQAVEAPT